MGRFTSEGVGTGRAAESGHWYDTSGNPAYTVKAKSGADRPATLRDARVLGLVPSVTTIIRCAAAPALEKWKRNQVLLSALTLSRLPEEAETAWLARVEQDWQETGRRAAERGNAIHAAVQGHYEGKPPEPEYWQQVKATRDSVLAHCGEQAWVAEASFAHPRGFGGKVDLHCKNTYVSGIWPNNQQGWVIDFKTKEFAPDKPPDALWDDHLMQLAAYRMGLCLPFARAGIAYVSSTHEATVIVEAPAEDLAKGEGMFLALLAYWQNKTGHRP